MLFRNENVSLVYYYIGHPQNLEPKKRDIKQRKVNTICEEPSVQREYYPEASF